MNVTLDQIKGIIQVVVPVLVASFASKFVPADQLAGFDAAIITVVTTLVAALWSAQTTKTKGNGNGTTHS